MRLSFREPVNSLTHLAGAILSALGALVLLLIALENGSVRQIVAFSIFGVSLVAMYCASAFYHSLNVSELGVARLRRLDQVMIYVLIAGTYTPVCLVLLRGSLGLALLISVWSLAVIGALQTMTWRNAPGWLPTAVYIGMGWISLIVARPLVAASRGFFYWILAGGVIYTVGAILHSRNWPRAHRRNGTRRIFGAHEIWHLCVIGGSFAHYWAILAYATRVP